MTNKLKIAHTSLHIEYIAGVHKMRITEAQAAKHIENAQWDVYISSPCDKFQNDYIKYVPVFRIINYIFKKDNTLNFYLKRIFTLNMLFVRIKYNLFVNRLTDEYDYVILRYNSADFFAFTFLKRKHKILFYHHSDEVEELKLYSTIGSLIEKITRKLHHKGCLGIIGVSPEILKIECKNIKTAKRLILPNGVFLKEDNVISFKGKPNTIKFVMISSVFHSYQGLELLIESIRSSKFNNFQVHFAGNVNEQQKKLIESTNRCVYDGLIKQNEAYDYLQKFSIGIGPLALYKKKLTQASALKVGEYLINGLPVIVGYDEFKFPNDFPYILKVNHFFSFNDFFEFALKMQSIPRKQIAQESFKYLNQVKIMNNFLEQLSK